MDGALLFERDPLQIAAWPAVDVVTAHTLWLVLPLVDGDPVGRRRRETTLTPRTVDIVFPTWMIRTNPSSTFSLVDDDDS
jgi:hypothetical protein